ncbi:MAG TPA: formimidoylglutamate deiminase [Crocinitomix sp.]|nr:formimidoylglutamate deiminase [Crocinitomix sp.]
MKTYQFKGVLTNNGWVAPATVQVDNQGRIVEISDNINSCQTSIQVDKVFDAYALPGFQNAHSHAFQYAMAGLAETHSTHQAPDDFWSWREAMYKLALSISPNDLEHIASMLYAEMLKHGYTNVAEFHYVHHDKNGKPYTNISEMGECLIAAAKNAGIGITLIPIFYQKGGFGKSPTEHQKRFISSTIDDYQILLDASLQSAKHYKHANVAIGIHSMRGVEPNNIIKVAEQFDQNLPFHIHISEQLKEIEDCTDYLNQRPVEWFLNNINTNKRFHFVHATHLVDEETSALAQSNANVVLCPSTEGNLGDGIFPLKKYQNYGGKWSIGTDSHIGLNPFEELRILDYGQRLTSHKRNTFYSNQQGDSGTYAFDMALKHGRMAMNNNESTYFKAGQPFDAVLIDATHPLIKTSSTKHLASTILFTSDATMIKGTFSKGRLVVSNGKHFNYSELSTKFINTINNLNNR